jgi:hypothetical protein
MQAPPIVRVRGLQDGSPEAIAVLQYFAPVVSGFVRAQRQNQEIAGLNHTRIVRDFPHMRVSYDRLFGREVVEVDVRADVVREVLRARRLETQDDIAYDGYMALTNVNSVRDDELQVYVNGEMVAQFDFDIDDEMTAILITFGEGGGRFAGAGDTDDRNPERKIRRCLPLREDDEDLQPYTWLYNNDNPVVRQVFRRELTFGLLPTDQNNITIRSIKNNGRANLGYFTAGFFSRAPVKYRRVVSSWRYTMTEDYDLPIQVNDFAIFYEGEYAMDFGEAVSATLDLRPDATVEPYTWLTFE